MPYFIESAEEDSASELYNSNSGSSGEEDGESSVHERKRKIRIGRERERKWLNHGDKALKTCRHFSYSLIECAWKFEWEAQQIADLLTLIIDELALDRAATIHMLLKSESVDIEIITCLMDRGMNFTTDDILNILQQSTSDAIRFCKAIGEALDQGLLTLGDDETLEAICRVPCQKNFSFNAVSCLVSLLVEHAPTKSLYGRCFAILTEHLSPQDIAGLGLKVVGSYVFRELKGSLDSFLSQISFGRNELETQINSKYHRDSGGEILESDEDSEGNLKDFVVDDDVLIMDTSAEEDGSSDEEEYENEEEDDDDDDNSVSLVGDDGKNMHFYRSVDMKHRKNNREEDGLWNTQPSPATKKEKKESKKRLRQDKDERKKHLSTKAETPLLENDDKGKKKKRFDFESSDEDVKGTSKPSFLSKKKDHEKKPKDIVSLDTSPEKSITKSKKLHKHEVKDVVSLISPPETLEKNPKTKNKSKGNISEDDEEFEMTQQSVFRNKAKPIKKNAAIRFDESDEEENDKFQQQRTKKQVGVKQASDSDSSSSSASSAPATKKVRRDLTSLFPSLPASSQAASQVLPAVNTIGVSKKPVEDVLEFSPVNFSPSQDRPSHHKTNHSSPASTNPSKSHRHKSPHEKKTSPSKKSASEKEKTDKRNASTKFMPAEEEDDDVIDDDDEESNAKKHSKKHHRKHHKHTPDKHPAEYYDF